MVANLRKGGFITPADVDELDAIRAAHYAMRFGQKGLGLTIIPTYACNFACDYCYENTALKSLSEFQTRTMPDDICQHIVNLCEKLVEERGCLSVTWYGGEPMLARSIIERLTTDFDRICREKKARYSAGMITNGYLLDPEGLEFVRRVQVRFLQVTLDGPRQINDARRPLTSGAGTYDKIVENLMRIADEELLNISLRMNVDRRNMSCVDDYFWRLRELGWHRRKNFSIGFGQVLQFGGSCLSGSSSCMNTPEFARFLVKGYRAAFANGFTEVDYPSRILSPCSAVRQGSYVIEPNGDVQTCWNSVGQQDKRVGTCTPDGIALTDNYVKWVGWTAFGQPMGCEQCAFLPSCMGGCPYKSLYSDELEDAHKNVCTSFRHNLPSMLELKRLAQQESSRI